MADEWTIEEASKAISISLVPSGSSHRKPLSFEPKLTYQLFENETIYGHKNLSIDLRFRDDDMSPALKVTSDRRRSDDTDYNSKVDDVEAILKRSLPENVPAELDVSSPTVLEQFVPPGQSIATYSVSSSPEQFEIFHAKLPAAKCKQILENMQILVLFFIEAGSVIELEDEDWTLDRWDVYFLYQKSPDGSHSFVGYCTVYNYYWFSTASFEDVRSRISQFIILPPFQKSGHGSRLYENIVSHLLAEPLVREITVEDPSEVFEEMRDIADVRRMKAAGLIQSISLDEIFDNRSRKNEWIRDSRSAAKMPLRQFQRVFEMLLLEHLSRIDKNSSKGKTFEKKFQLLVKERLYKHNRDVLQQLDRKERKQKLDETYDNVVRDYEALLERCKLKDMHKKLHLHGTMDGKRPSNILQSPDEADRSDNEEPPHKRSRI